MRSYVFYATFGHGQPGFPGYLRCTAEACSRREAELIVRLRLNENVKRWCGLYQSLDELHELDRIFRGEA